jgi:hypothetical protein
MCRGFAVVGTMLAMSSMFACASDDADKDTDSPTAKKDVQNASVKLDAKAASSNTTAVLNNQTFEVPSTVLAQNATPTALADALTSNTKTAIAFSNVSAGNGQFAMTNPTASGTLKIASCTFTVTAPANLAGTIFIENCAIKVNADGVPAAGGGTASGTATLELNGVSSDPVTVTVSIGADGTLVVNDHPTQTVVTGTSGG